MPYLEYLGQLDVKELETIHDYLSRAKLPTGRVFWKAALDVLCMTDDDIAKMKQNHRRYQLLIGILTLLMEE